MREVGGSGTFYDAMETGTTTRILGIETASPAGGVALVDSAAGLLAEIRSQGGRPHAEGLGESIPHLFSLAGISIETVDGFAVSIGPGSFTGLRIGLSLAKGLCFGTDRPVVPVPTLAALASGVCFGGLPVRVMMDARRNEVYTALFTGGRGGVPRRLEPDAAVRPEDVLARIHEPTVMVGDWVMKNQAKIRRRLGRRAVFVGADGMVPSPARVALLGLNRFRKGRLPTPDEMVPAYLRPSEAEVKWRAHRQAR